jgi:phosphomethylpyrimidine synthase
MLTLGTVLLPQPLEEEVEKRFGLVVGSRYDYGFIYRKNIHETREWIIRNSPSLLEQCHLPSFGKVNGIAEDLTWEIFVIL